MHRGPTWHDYQWPLRVLDMINVYSANRCCHRRWFRKFGQPEKRWRVQRIINIHAHQAVCINSTINWICNQVILIRRLTRLVTHLIWINGRHSVQMTLTVTQLFGWESFVLRWWRVETNHSQDPVNILYQCELVLSIPRNQRMFQV